VKLGYRRPFIRRGNQSPIVLWISDVVRLEKVALCLVWSILIFLLYACRYGMAARALVALLASVLLFQVVDAVLKMNLDAIPYLYLVVTNFLLAITWHILSVLVPAILAYAIWAKRAFAHTHLSMASAITLGACAMMVWIGLLDIIYPGIGWR
jgi:hypothetical protein